MHLPMRAFVVESQRGDIEWLLSSGAVVVVAEEEEECRGVLEMACKALKWEVEEDDDVHTAWEARRRAR